MLPSLGGAEPVLNVQDGTDEKKLYVKAFFLEEREVNWNEANPNTVTALRKTHKVFHRSKTGIVCLKPFRGIDPCPIFLSLHEELYCLYDETDLVTSIRITRLRWAGHIVRMQDNQPCKKINLDKPEGRRRVGRPNLRWMDGVTKDAERLGVRNWRIKARDRDGWRRLLE
jgi:hypothetical protein